MKFSSSDLSVIIVAIITTIGGIITAIIQINSKKPKKNHKKTRSLYWFLIILPFLLLYILLFNIKSKSNISILYPKNNQIVKPYDTIFGNYRNIPDSLSVWIFTKNERDIYYYPFQTHYMSKYNWTTNIIPIGNSVDNGKPFRIFVCTVPPLVNDSLIIHINNPSSSGFSQIPSLVKIWASCIVTRGN